MDDSVKEAEALEFDVAEVVAVRGDDDPHIVVAARPGAVLVESTVTGRMAIVAPADVASWVGR